MNQLELKGLPKKMDIAPNMVEMAVHPKPRRAQEKQQRNAGCDMEQPSLHAGIVSEGSADNRELQID